jgi:hypothetical protein
MLYPLAESDMAIEPTGAGGGTVEIGTRRPAPPANASFAIEIKFEKGTENPSRVFRAAEVMIRALQSLDQTLCAAVDPHIEPVMVLEDVEASSIRVWLANVLSRVDDGALKELEWKPLVGRYLVKAKYAVIRWTNKTGAEGGLLGLAREIRSIAAETDIKHLPDYAPPSIQELSAATRLIDDAKSILLPSDKMAFLTRDESPLDFDLTVKWSTLELSDLAVKETTKFEKMPLTLVVKRPDYLGKSRWDFRHGRKPIPAKIEDEAWLIDFQTRKIDVRPGDALRCLVTIENKYGFDNELIAEDYVVTKVEAVLENQITQGGLSFGRADIAARQPNSPLPTPTQPDTLEKG